MDESLTSRKYFDGIYIPVGLLVFGTTIVKREWVPYAVLLSLVLGVVKYFRMRTLFTGELAHSHKHANSTPRAEEGPQARRLPRV